MRTGYRKIDKYYPFENETGLSSYDLALIAIAKKYKKNKSIQKVDYEKLLSE